MTTAKALPAPHLARSATWDREWRTSSANPDRVARRTGRSEHADEFAPAAFDCSARV